MTRFAAILHQIDSGDILLPESSAAAYGIEINQVRGLMPLATSDLRLAAC